MASVLCQLAGGGRRHFSCCGGLLVPDEHAESDRDERPGLDVEHGDGLGGEVSRRGEHRRHHAMCGDALVAREGLLVPSRPMSARTSSHQTRRHPPVGRQLRRAPPGLHSPGPRRATLLAAAGPSTWPIALHRDIHVSTWPIAPSLPRSRRSTPLCHDGLSDATANRESKRAGRGRGCAGRRT